jgi:hypothetical protein
MSNYFNVYQMSERNKEQSRQDRIGRVYGDFVVVDVIFRDSNKQIWEMKCTKCGKLKTTQNGREFHKAFQKGKNNSLCDCNFAEQRATRREEKRQQHERGEAIKSAAKIRKKQKEDARAAREQHLDSRIGEKHGNLTCVERLTRGYRFQCDCGREIESGYFHVKNGDIKTCGDKLCRYRIEGAVANGTITHWASGTGSQYERLYNVYRGMIQRCHNENNSQYLDYGGRGITVCEEWRNDFMKFRDWAIDNGWTYEPRESGVNKWSIDRINNDKGYAPDNCRWATMSVQRRNQRPCEERVLKKTQVEINGVIKLKKEWCAEYGISPEAVRYRMKTLGMTFEQAVTLPKNQGNAMY